MNLKEATFCMPFLRDLRQEPVVRIGGPNYQDKLDLSDLMPDLEGFDANEVAHDLIAEIDVGEYGSTLRSLFGPLLRTRHTDFADR